MTLLDHYLKPTALPAPMVHEPGIREQNEGDVILAMGITWGCGFAETHRRLRMMNFVDFDFPAIQGEGDGN